ncbi:MAG: glycine zipper family protein [Methylococcales bacterium]|nr:glycine zipper family protein [Methylococcales bacterium]
MLDYIECFIKKLRTLSLVIFGSLLTVSLFGCSHPSTYSVKQYPVSTPSLSSTEIIFYPKHGQNEYQQQRDRYECHLWAVKKSGFDPNQAQLMPHQRFEVKASPPPGTGAAIGALSGAVIGSITSRRYRSVEGMVFGAITGALMGAASDIARHQEANRIQHQYNENDTYRHIQLEKQARDYRRALSACLEGRRYTVE